MAQASGLMNVIRQVGGSFGVAILQTLLTQRVLYHTAVAGATLDRSSPLFSRSLQMLQAHAMHDAGSSIQSAMSQNSMIIMSHFSQQMFVWGINDDFLISAACTAVCIIPIIILKTKKRVLQ